MIPIIANSPKQNKIFFKTQPRHKDDILLQKEKNNRQIETLPRNGRCRRKETVSTDEDEPS